LAERKDNNPIDPDGTRTPVPDPTVLTTQNLQREIAGVQELFERRMADQEKLNRERFHRLDEKFDLAERQRLELKADTKDAVDAALAAQKNGVREQTEATERASSKAEAAINKQLDQISVMCSTAANDLRRSINEVKERVVAVDKDLRQVIAGVDSKADAVVQQKAGAKEDRSGLYATLAVGISVILALIAVATFIVSSRPPVISP
jgi:hypothetical protein